MPVQCLICDKIFTLQKNLNRHLRNVHNKTEKNVISYEESTRGSVYKSKCSEIGCNSCFMTIGDLREHLRVTHNFEIQQDILKFETVQDFHIWLNSLSTKENVHYVYHSTKKNLSNGTETTYYYCNRSGVSRQIPKDNRKRKLKSQGSCKLGRTCISSIVLIKYNNTEECNVTYFKKHNHSIELQHLRLAKEDRLSIAAKLNDGVTISRILDTNRNDIQANSLKRRDLLTREDVNNIKTAFNIDVNDGVRHRNDVVSVDLWIEDYKNQQNVTLVYKKQGEDHPFLHKNDFCLIFMNNSQEHMLKTHGSKIICLDSTHGLNSYDFELTTILIIDEFGEGFPGACMFTNRKDTFINEFFFQQIKLKTGPISTNVFMSDITTVFYEAWKKCMGSANHQLFCSWHIDRAWRNNLNKITNVEKRKMVYHSLKVLQIELNQAEFLKQLSNFLKCLDDDEATIGFGDYFKSNYVSNYRQWAYCYRKCCGINTNMHLESMHKVIKYIYLDGKKVKRLDKGLHAMSTFIRNKLVDRIIKNIKGKNSSHILVIDKRHQIALNSSFPIKYSETCGTWSVESDNNIYYVTKNLTETVCCPLKCTTCNVCIHNYKCTCVDFFIKTTICKHIHYVIIHFSLKDRNMSVENDYNKSNLNQEVACHLRTLEVTKIENENPKKSYTELVKQKCSQINQLDLSDVSDNNLHYAAKSLNNIYNILTIKQTDSEKFPKVSNVVNEPPNKKIDKQLTFHTTKKRKKNSQLAIRKPSKDNIINIKHSLMCKPFISSSSDIDHNYL